MKTFDHYDSRSIEETVGLLSQYRGKARLNAGGTDLLGLLKDMALPRYPELIVNIKTIPGLEYIEEDAEKLRIGALTKLADIARSPLLMQNYAAIAEAARAVAAPQIRNVATLGGNLCQEVRCWYYRYPAHLGGGIECARKGQGPCLAVKGDNRYHAVIGGKKCFAVCPSDLATALAALDGRVRIVGAKGERHVGMGDFFNPMGNALEADEMVKEIEVPKTSTPRMQAFLKYTLRKPIDFAIVSAACAIAVEDGVCADARIILGAVAPGPYRAKAAEEALIGKALDQDAASRAGAAALEGARPFGKNEYKIEVAKALVERAVLEAGGKQEAGGGQ